MNKEQPTNHYTRRQFLSIMGAASAGAYFLPGFSQNSSALHLQGRALKAALVYASPHPASPVISRLWPDSITTILDLNEGWYHVSEGFVQRENLQPMTPFEPVFPLAIVTAPFWAEVNGPVASVRTFCAANAPLVTRIGHGGVAQVIDFLPGEPFGWYAVGDEKGQLTGWSQAAVWQAVTSKPKLSESQNTLQIDRLSQRITAWDGSQVLFEAACSTSELAQPGSYSVQSQQPHDTYKSDANENFNFYGIPWVTKFADSQVLAGAYWHNRFGESLPGPAVQVSPLTARWLYQWLNENSTIIIE